MAQQKPSRPTVEVTRVLGAGQGHVRPAPGSPAQIPLAEPPAATALSANSLPDLETTTLPTFAHELRCDQTLCALASVVPERQFLKSRHSERAPNAALWVYRIAENSTVLFPENDAVELYALVLKGSFAVSSAQAETANLKAWSLAQADGAGLSLSATVDSAVVIAVVSKAGPLDQAVAESNRLKVRGGSAAAARAKMTVVELPKIAPVTWGGGRFSARLAFGGDSGLTSVASFGILSADAHGAIPENVHAIEWEHLVILASDGTLQLGGHPYPVQAGSVLQIEPQAPHAFTPSGKSALLAIQLFSAKGPERRYLDLAKLAQSGRK